MTVKKVLSVATLILLSVQAAVSADADKYWIFLKDKSATLSKIEVQAITVSLSNHALWRRAKINPTTSLVDLSDAPVCPHYLDKLAENGIKPVTVSKWLNAVSAYTTPEQAATVRSLPFVKSVQKVARGKRRLPQTEQMLLKSAGESQRFALDYGASVTQNAIIRVPEVHSLGLSGEGVVIAVLDAGFSLIHPAFSSLKLVATHDFINNDDEVGDQQGDPYGENDHGAKVLSMLGGYAPGYLIGPAYGSSFLLAKTEDISSETMVEEDYWIAAAEWAEAHGADVINSSLGYIDWYIYADMNGLTAPITLAADMAVQKGVVVVVSAGNEGDDSWYYVSAPADGFNVIAAGAVRADSLIAGFSSHGPTSDGRIKPDVVAMGVNNVFANSSGEGYGSGSGTSYSSPMVAGAVALILSAHPELTPADVYKALVKTADRAKSPDNTYGFGLINTLAAVNYWGSIGDPSEENRFLSVSPNPFSYHIHNGISFHIDLKELSRITIDIYTVLGQRVGRVVDIDLPGNRNSTTFWDGKTPAGSRLASGVYIYRIHIGGLQSIGKMTILQ